MSFPTAGPGRLGSQTAMGSEPCLSWGRHDGHSKAERPRTNLAKPGRGGRGGTAGRHRYQGWMA